MKKQDVELVLTKSMDFWREKMDVKVNLIEIFDLSQKIWQEIQFEKNSPDDVKDYFLTRSDLETIISNGDLIIEYEDGSTARFFLEEELISVSILENGKLVISKSEGDEE